MNDSDQLTLFDGMTRYDDGAAETLANELIQSKGSATGAYGKLVTCAPSSTQCAEETLRRLGSRAYRRPLTEGSPSSELSRLLGVFAKGPDFDTGLADAGGGPGW